jgi:hypothetical protein
MSSSTNTNFIKMQISKHKRIGEIIAILSAGFVPFYLLWLILSGSHMQFADYFNMLGSMYSNEGVFNPPGMFRHANEHLVLIPKLIFLFNIYFFDGSNIALGVIVWLISAIAAILVWRQLKFIFQSSIVNRILVAWLLASFFFPLSAAHNYLHAMSGTSWLLANLFSVCAVIFIANRRYIGAAIFGAFATFSYGTGLAIWPALLFLVVLDKHFSWKNMVVPIIGLASIVVERVTSHSVAGYHPSIQIDPLAIIRSIQIAGGSILTNSIDLAMIFGAIFLIFTAIFLLHVLSTNNINAAEKMITGMVIYALTALVLMAVARSGFGDGVFLSSRYMGVVALFVFSVSLLSYFIINNSILWQGGVTLIIILNLSAAVPVVSKVQNNVLKHQTLGAIATRLGVANGLIFGHTSRTNSILQALNHYPFNAAGDRVFCGLLGEKVKSSLSALDHGIHGWFDSSKPLDKTSGFQVDGWAFHAERKFDCILIVDSANVVVGAAELGWAREDARRSVKGKNKNIGWKGYALATPGSDLSVLVRLQGQSGFFLLNKSKKNKVTK